MKDKKDNNLIKVTFQDGTVHYYTSIGRCSKSIKRMQPSLEYYLNYKNGILPDGLKVEIADGSNVKYKDIN